MMLINRIKATLIFYLIFLSSGFSQSADFERIEATVYFDFDSSNLTENAELIIEKLFPFDSDFYPEYISLTGFTDKSGNKDYNQKLSKKRALAVQTYIKYKHISNTEFKIDYVGEDQPAYGCDDNLNRCVKILMVLKAKEEPVSIERCKELFPEEFTTKISEPELLVEEEELEELIPTEEQLDDSNKFQKKVISDAKDTIRLNDILFYGNSDRYYSSAEPELEDLAAFLLANSSFDIKISGHVNGGKNSSRQLRKESRFNDIYDLSLARADAIKKFLVEKGVSASRIEVAGKGGEEPIFKKPKTAAESAANRRIEITFIRIEN